MPSWKCSEERKCFLHLRAATICLQIWWRNVRETRKKKLRKPMVIRLQRRWRTVLLMKTQRDQYRNLRNAALIIQRRWRAMKIGNECGEAMHFQDVTKLANSESVYWKTIIINLRNCDNVEVLDTCLNSLDIITKLSPTVCIILCELNLGDDIYKTIEQNNRSQPWMQVCLQACSILITLTKHDYARRYTIKNKYALALMKLLNGSLKNKEVFLHCATLIWLLSQNEDYSKAMVTCPQINWHIKTTKNQQKILKDDKVTKLQKLKDVEKLYPSCEPDRRNTQKPRIFTDMSIAIAACQKNLNYVNS
ncbi:unnamed protein product [Lasius platythorax]|uniref:Protein abnormal spindle n=1 Tax=Lasius platythorax TaxID=488582 RepID=A0AAV2NP40_9HYME